ncbi:UNVERIFIED_CONTAM: hypothetical protein HDU68_006285 [Siphonaria sp. JEL0065]|nr:hypothetical protein HDU68_006285 [Siphonaria sp. JEL0065]
MSNSRRAFFADIAASATQFQPQLPSEATAAVVAPSAASLVVNPTVNQVQLPSTTEGIQTLSTTAQPSTIIQSLAPTSAQPEVDHPVSNKSIAAAAVGGTFGFLLACFLVWLLVVRIQNYLKKKDRKYERMDEDIEFQKPSGNSQSRVYRPGEYGRLVESGKQERLHGGGSGSGGGSLVRSGTLFGAGRSVTVRNVTKLRDQAHKAKQEALATKQGYEMLDGVDRSNINDSSVEITPRMLADAKGPLVETEKSASLERDVLKRGVTTGGVRLEHGLRYYDPDHNTLIPLLAPVLEIVDADTKESINLSSLESITEFSERVEQTLLAAMDSISSLPLDQPTQGTNGLQRVSTPQRQYHHQDSTQLIASSSVDTLSEQELVQIKFEAQYSHAPKRRDELALQIGDIITVEKFLKDGWAIGVNHTDAEKRGCFPLFVVEEAAASSITDRIATGFSRLMSVRSTSTYVEAEPVV